MKMNRFQRALSGIAVAGLVGVAGADTLELRDGRILDGVLIGATGDTLYLRSDGQVRRVNIGEVDAVRFDRRSPVQSERGSGDSLHKRAVIVAAGASIMVALPKDLVRETLAEGDRFTAYLSEDFRTGDVVVSTAGSKVYGLVTSPSPGSLAITLTDLTVEGDRLHINTGSRPLPTGGEAGANLEFRVQRPFTLRLASS